MKSFLSLLIALTALNTNLYSAEAGMPQLDPKYWASQAFWLILVFVILYISLSKFLTFIKLRCENLGSTNSQMNFQVKEYSDQNLNSPLQIYPN